MLGLKVADGLGFLHRGRLGADGFGFRHGRRLEEECKAL
jgi:hypothetical protein